MGQRHQAFLITRLIPHGEQTKAYYRCIAAVHHQWCYGRLPLSATRRFLNLVKNPENATIVRDEIRRAQGKYGCQGEEPKIPDMAFPYTQFLFVQAWNMDIDSPRGIYTTGMGFEESVLDPNVGCFDYSNDDGITVIDITDPLDPAYCHILDSTALDAATYVRSYYETDSEDSPVEMDIRCHIAALEKERLVSDEALYEVWPKVFKSYGQEKSSLVQSGEASIASPLPPLADLALRQVVDQCIAEDDFEPLETLTDMPGKMESVAAALFLKKALPDSAQGVLSGVLQFELGKNGGIVDLSSSRCTLSADMVRALIPSLPSDAVRAFNLSGMHTLAPSIIVDILTTYPKLMRLTLLDTNITEEQIIDLLYNQPELFFNIHDLIHPALLTRAPPVSAKISVDDPEGLRAVYQRFSSGPQGFTIIQSGTPDMLFNLQPTITSIPYFHPEKVLRGLAICLRPLEVGFDSSLRAKKYLASQLGPLMALSIATPLVPHPVIPSTFSSDSEDRLRWLHRSISTVPIKGSYDDFRAHGWLFVLKYTPGSFFSPIPHATYGFIKVDEKVHAPVLQELMEDAWKAWKAHKDSKAEGGTEAAKPNDNALPVLPVDLATLIKVYDVRGFADAVEKEGRPRPSEEAIAALEEVLDDEFVVEGLPPSKVFTQMDLEEAKTFIPIASQRIRFT